MENFDGKIAVITGGGTGMGRELTYQLAAEGCHVSICDVIEENMEETFLEATKKYPHVKITKHLCDVSSEEDVLRFRDDRAARFTFDGGIRQDSDTATV